MRRSNARALHNPTDYNVTIDIPQRNESPYVRFSITTWKTSLRGIHLHPLSFMEREVQTRRVSLFILGYIVFALLASWCPIMNNELHHFVYGAGKYLSFDIKRRGIFEAKNNMLLYCGFDVIGMLSSCVWFFVHSKGSHVSMRRLF